VVQNNGWALSCPRSRQTAAQTLAQKALAYGFDGIQVDGNDILGMIVATREAVEKARTGGGPTLIEALTYRLSVHTTADDPRKYRTEDEVKAWEPRDPLLRYRIYLQNRKLLDAKIERVIDEEVEAEVEAAVRAYEQFRADPLAFFRHMYAEMTPELERQLGELRAYLNRSSAEAQPRDLSRAL
jgi:pyruvate dehydrogenase E1 component alpha subunit